MKKTQWIELVRMIRKTIVTFLSISIIIALGVSVYLGINYAAHSLKDMKNVVLKTQNYRDFEIISALGIDQENIEKLKKLDNIEQVEGTYIVDGTVTKGAKTRSVSLAGMTELLNKPVLKQGKEPESEKECAVDEKIAQKLNLKPGDIITIQSTSSNEAIAAGKYKVSGIVSYADTLKSKTYIFFQKSCFKKEVFENAYTNIYIKMKGSLGQHYFAKNYITESDEVYSLLEKAGVEQSTKRFQRVYDKWKAKLDEGKAQLLDAQEKIKDGEKKIQDGETQIAQNEEKLRKAQEKISSGEEELKKGWTKLENGKAQLAEAKAKLDAAWTQLEDGRGQLEDGRNQLEASQEQLDQSMAAYEAAKENMRELILEKIEKEDFEGLPEDVRDWIVNAKEEVEERITNLDMTQSIDGIINQFTQEMNLGEEGSELVFSVVQKLEQYEKIKKIEDDFSNTQNQIDTGWKEYNEKSALYEEKLGEYNAKYAEYEKAQQTYQDGLATYQKKSAELEAGKASYAQGQQQLEKAKQELESGKEELAKKKQEYENGVETYKEQETKLNGLKETPWYVLGRNASYAYLIGDQNSKKLSGIGFTFALTLMLVAIMVCYASISRMIQEQRTLIGAQKALGFTTHEIMERYCLYTTASVLLGLAAGIALAYFVIQPVAVNAYVIVGGYGAETNSFLPQMTLIVSVCALVIALFSTWMGCHTMLKRPAIELMKEEAPHVTGTVLDHFDWWNKMPLLTKATVNNMVTEKTRVFTTLAGVVGCTVLLVMGFTLKLSSDKIPDRQYNELIKYDGEVKISLEKTTEDTEKEIDKVLEKYKVSWIPAMKQSWTYRAGDYVNTLSLIGSNDDLSGYFSFPDQKTKEELKPVKDGVLICEGIADAYGLKAGDSIQLIDSSGNGYDLKIKGVYENHVWQTMVISPEYYKKVFGEEMPQNVRLLKGNEALEKQLKTDLLKISSVNGVNRSDSTRSVFEEMSGATNVILVMLIGMSLLMAIMILLNLAVMNINQKKRELAVMRVNGFTLRETKRYVGMDTIFITVAGILLGLLIGSGLSVRVQNTLNTVDLQFLRGIRLDAWGRAVAVIVIFTILIRWIANKKIKKLNLTNVNDA